MQVVIKEVGSTVKEKGGSKVFFITGGGKGKILEGERRKTIVVNNHHCKRPSYRKKWGQRGVGVEEGIKDEITCWSE